MTRPAATFWNFRGTADAAGADLVINDTPLEALRAQIDAARWRWSPGFHAGLVEAELDTRERAAAL